MTLYELDGHLQSLLDARAELIEQRKVYENASDAIPENIEGTSRTAALIRDCEYDIARYTEAMLAKVDGTAAFIRNLRAVEETCEAEAERIAQRAKQAHEDRKYLEGLVLSLMEQKGEKKLKGKFNTFTSAGNGGLQPLEIRQPDLVPLSKQTVLVEVRADVYEDLSDQFTGCIWVVRPAEPDRTAIRNALERGEAVPGCILGDRGKHLLVK